MKRNDRIDAGTRGVGRRQLGALGLGAAGLGLAATLGAGRADAQTKLRIRAMWWGSPDRARRTNEVAKLFEEKTGIQVAGEPVGADYFPKLAVMMAGRNIPDVIHLEPSSLSDYAKRGACRPLDEYVPATIRTSEYGPRMVDLCKVDGKLWGIGLGLNSFSLFYDTEAFERTGLTPPTPRTTWTEYADLAVELGKRLGGTMAASPNGSRYHYVFDAWLRQRGKSLFAPEGGLGFAADDAAEWFTYWEDLRKRGGTVAPEVSSLDMLQIDSNALALGKSAIGFTFSNQLIGYQLLKKSKLGITMLPRAQADGPSGHYYRPALIWSVGSTTRNPEAAARFIDFFTTDLEAGKILGVERGVPMSTKVREAILPDLNEVERATVEYVNLLTDQVSAYPPPAPRGAIEFDQNHLRRVADRISFGQLGIAEGSKLLVAEGASALQI